MAAPAATGPPFGILISGRGSNMEALIAASQAGRLPAQPAIVVSSSATAPGLALATKLGVETEVVEPDGTGSRWAHDEKVLAVLASSKVQLVCLAGYMRLLSPAFTATYPGAIMNVHPSLLPAFPGLAAPRQALQHGVRVSGCTVHFVDDGLDTGPIIAQAAVEVRDDDDEDSLAARILEQEHRLYPLAVQWFFEDRLKVSGRRVRHLPPGSA